MERVRIGSVELDVTTSENPKDSVTVTDKPVEDSQDVSDHVKKNPSIINLRGQITEDAAEKLQQLQKYQRDGELVKYIGRNAYNNMVVEDIDRDHGVRNRLGFEFNIRLKQVRIATAQEIQMQVASNIRPQVKPVTNKGKLQPRDKKAIMLPGLSGITLMTE